MNAAVSAAAAWGEGSKAWCDGIDAGSRDLWLAIALSPTWPAPPFVPLYPFDVQGFSASDERPLCREPLAGEHGCDGDTFNPSTPSDSSAALLPSFSGAARMP